MTRTLLALLAAGASLSCGGSPPPPAPPTAPAPVVSLETPPPSPPPAPPAEAAPAPAAASAPETPTDITSLDGPPGTWVGAQGNTAFSVVGIWGASGHVFAVGPGVVLHSSDRGVHWSTWRSPSTWAAVWGSSVDDVYVAGDTVWHSVDRGATWTPSTTPAGNVSSLWGSGPGDVWVAGNEAAPGRGDPGEPFVAVTRDHGKTWQPVHPRLPQGAWLNSVSGTGPNDVWVAGSAHVKDPKSGIGYHTVPVLVRSTDRGKMWKAVQPAATGMTDNEEIRNVCFTASGMLVASYAYGVFTSKDAGKTWTSAMPVGTEIVGLTCSGQTILVGARNCNFRRSTDEGAHWTSDDLAPLWPKPVFFTLQAAFVADTGEEYVGGEAYNRHGGGTLLRRAP